MTVDGDTSIVFRCLGCDLLYMCKFRNIENHIKLRKDDTDKALLLCDICIYYKELEK